ncbi:MAG: transcription antitermination factor NusB [Microthrixaceae bacterium]
MTDDRPGEELGAHGTGSPVTRTPVTAAPVAVPRVPDGAPVSESVIDTVLDSDAVVEQIDVEPPPVVRPVAGGRHEARERAVHLLYESRIKELPIGQVLAAQVLAPDEYTDSLVRGVVENQASLDEVLSRLVRGWSLERMATLDLVVLQVACFELAHRPDVPRGVVLAEAVDLAGRYGTDDSARFVNGVLASAADELRPV